MVVEINYFDVSAGLEAPERFSVDVFPILESSLHIAEMDEIKFLSPGPAILVLGVVNFEKDVAGNWNLINRDNC
jgi:hypothetical protein